METDIRQVREVSILLLNTDIKLCDELPPEIHVYHPFFTSSISKLGDDFLDIVKNKDDLRRIINHMSEIINKNDISVIFSMINTPYKLTWYRYVQSYLSDKDRAYYLTQSWTSEENPNMDANCSIRYVISQFKKCRKELLMNKADLDYYNSLPEEFTIYRGVSVGRNPKGISFTRNLETAKWFSRRFDSETEKGYILTATGHKDKVLAYLNTRHEDEIVYDTKGLKLKRLECVT